MLILYVRWQAVNVQSLQQFAPFHIFPFIFLHNHLTHAYVLLLAISVRTQQFSFVNNSMHHIIWMYMQLSRKVHPWLTYCFRNDRWCFSGAILQVPLRTRYHITDLFSKPTVHHYFTVSFYEESKNCCTFNGSLIIKTPTDYLSRKMHGSPLSTFIYNERTDSVAHMPDVVFI